MLAAFFAVWIGEKLKNIIRSVLDVRDAEADQANGGCAAVASAHFLVKELQGEFPKGDVVA